MIQTLIGSNELDAFYKDKFYFSYSSISKLLFSPAAFYNHYVLKQREDVVAPHLISGRVLHCLLFEPEKYDDIFISMPGKLPTDSQKKIIDNLLVHPFFLLSHHYYLKVSKQDYFFRIIRSYFI